MKDDLAAQEAMNHFGLQQRENEHYLLLQDPDSVVCWAQILRDSMKAGTEKFQATLYYDPEFPHSIIRLAFDVP